MCATWLLIDHMQDLIGNRRFVTDNCTEWSYSRIIATYYHIVQTELSTFFACASRCCLYWILFNRSTKINVADIRLEPKDDNVSMVGEFRTTAGPQVTSSTTMKCPPSITRMSKCPLYFISAVLDACSHSFRLKCMTEVSFFFHPCLKLERSGVVWIPTHGFWHTSSYTIATRYAARCNLATCATWQWKNDHLHIISANWRQI